MNSDQTEKTLLFTLESARQNIIEIRNWIFQLTIISIGIIGFTLPVLSTSQLIKNNCFLIGGLFLLWLEVLLAFGYLRYVLSTENNKLTRQINELLKNNQVSKEKSDTKDYILDILYIVFIIATLLIIISMINF